MEALYSKLYNKYTKIKTKKLSELDQLNLDQEVKFVSYVSAAEDLIKHLKNENDKMRAEINDLRSEVASIRSAMDDKCVEYQKLLMEENQKNTALSEEVERVRKLQLEGHFGNSEDGENNSQQLSTPVAANVISYKVRHGSAKKRKRLSGSETVECTALSDGAQDNGLIRESSKDLCTLTGSSGALVNDWQPKCCRRTTGRSGGINESGPSNCLFQALIENLVGMKLSAINQTEGISVSALHQSTGYSFCLSWVIKSGGEETELLYRVQSLGTFERVAPEWMREVLMFSTSMLPIFFERLARVIKLHP